VAELPTLLMFPGLGVDGRLFEPQRSLSANIITPPWLEPMEFESIQHYAWRMIRDLKFHASGNLWIGGVSFGGIIALEAARYLNPRGVLLIASLLDRRELSWLARSAAHVTSSLPIPIIACLLKVTPLFFRFAGRANRKQRRLLLKMIEDSNLSLVKWGPRQIANYVFTQRLKCPIYRMHGTADRIVPPPQDSRLIRIGGGHIANLTNWQQMNFEIARIIST
jgi:pimeloyl-ACP methyl ester carboxylesterase